MHLTAHPEQTGNKSTSDRLAKAAILVSLSLGLLWFSENVSPASFFESQSTGWVLWVSYARDLIQPFAFYFLLCLGERWLRTWQTRATIALAVPLLLEIGQGSYYQFSPNRYIGSFDPLDIVMYSISVALAVVLEQHGFAKKLNIW